MAIYPYFSTTILNKDVLTNSSFKAGMALIMNSNGVAIKADSQSLVFDSVYQKYGRFLGFAASDHDISGNTIIIPDVIGSNYIDSNFNFIKSENTEYSVPKRAILDYQDSAVSNFYNTSDLTNISKRGIGVYNTPGDYFVTDQFNPVLHGDYGVDSTTTTTLNPGDLLTFGGGINAGKLVKVNLDSFGPDVIVLGQVFKHLPSAGLLYFRQVNYRLSFGNVSSTRLSLDAGNISSFSSPSSTTAIDMSGNNNGTLFNGVTYDTAGGGSWSFDGTNDYIDVPLTNYTLNIASVTVFCWVNLSLPTFGTFFHLGGNNNGITVGVGNVYTQDPGTKVVVLYPGVRWITNSYNMGTYSNGWNFVAISFDSSKYPTIYLNNNSGVYIAYNDFNTVGPYTVTIGREVGIGVRYLTGKISDLRMYSRVLSASEVLAYYNSTRGRYGL